MTQPQPVPDTRIETYDIQRMLRTTKNAVSELEKVRVRNGPAHRDRAAELAKAQRDLLFVVHLLDKTKILVMDEYHAIRGRTAHLLDEQ